MSHVCYTKCVTESEVNSCPQEPADRRLIIQRTQDSVFVLTRRPTNALLDTVQSTGSQRAKRSAEACIYFSEMSANKNRAAAPLQRCDCSRQIQKPNIRFSKGDLTKVLYQISFWKSTDFQKGAHTVQNKIDRLLKLIQSADEKQLRILLSFASAFLRNTAREEHQNG